MHSHRVQTYILALVPNHADAEELLQETAVTAWESFDQFESGSDFRAWAFGIAFNKVRNFRRLRRHKMTQLSDRFVELVDQATTDHRELLDTQGEALTDCFAKLSETDQNIINKRYEDGASVESVAQSVGRSPSTVYRSITRIHHLLLECVTKAIRRGDAR